MEHLIELGHRRIGVVGAPARTEPIQRRIRGAREALSAYDVDADPACLVTGDQQDFDMGYQSARQLMALAQPPTAIFSLTDVTAVGAIHALSELGMSVPEDISVLGYDNIPIASYMIPQLSTIAQPIIDMGKTAVELLCAHLDDPAKPMEEAVLQTRLIVRQSTNDILT
jgi:DNA-binding LacI/PurR family transcriptional regulator